MWNFSVLEKSKLLKNYNEYTIEGGIPAFIQNKNPEYLKSLLNTILYKDVLVRNKLTNEKALLDLIYFLGA